MILLKKTTIMPCVYCSHAAYRS